jgi:hypothetical protein
VILKGLSNKPGFFDQRYQRQITGMGVISSQCRRFLRGDRYGEAVIHHAIFRVDDLSAFDQTPSTIANANDPLFAAEATCPSKKD